MEDQPKKQKSDAKYYAFGVKLMVGLGFSIAVPAVLAGWLGQYLDEKYYTYPLFLVLCLVNAALITARVVISNAKKYGQEYEDLGKPEKK